MRVRTILAVAMTAAALVSAQGRVTAQMEEFRAEPKGVSACEGDCDERGCWLLVYRYTVNTAMPEQRPLLVTKELFDGKRFATRELAYACTEELRRTGAALPTLGRFNGDSNVVPESITPMPHL